MFQRIAEAWAIHPGLLPRAGWRESWPSSSPKAPAARARHPPRHQFSGRQRRRIAIARAMTLEPQLISCGRAVSALDVSVKARVIELLDDLRCETGIAFILIAHDLPVVRDFADHAMAMRKGREVETDPVAQLFGAPDEDCTCAVLASDLESAPEVQDLRRAEHLRAAF